MKNMNNISYSRLPVRIFYLILALAALALLATGCADYNGDDLTGVRAKAKIPNADTNTRNSSSQASDYSISLTVVDSTWTYIITKNPGAKDLSHFILNFQNCGASSATALENSEGKPVATERT